MRFLSTRLLVLLVICCAGLAAQGFVAPADGTLLIEVQRDDGGRWRFGVGNSEADFREVLRNFPSRPIGAVPAGAVRAGEIVTFGMWTEFGGNSAWAFSNRTDPASLVAFRDGDNRLGFGGSTLQRVSEGTWIWHLDNAVSYLYDDDNNDIVLRLTLTPPGSAPTPPLSFQMPFRGRLFVQAAGGWAAATTRFGLGRSVSSFRPLLSGLPNNPTPVGEVLAGTFEAGATVDFAMETDFGGVGYAFSSQTDLASLIAFGDRDNSLPFGGSILERVNDRSWLLHLDDARSVDDDDDDVFIRLRVEAEPLSNAPQLEADGVVNAASFVQGVSPGGLATIFGARLFDGFEGTRFPGGALEYNGTSVRIGGSAAPILSLTRSGDANQINVQVPFETPAARTVAVEVSNRAGGIATTGGIPTFESDPGIFEVSLAGGVRVAAATHQDGRLVTPDTPAQRGEVLSLFVTGGGPVSPQVGSGTLGPVPPASMTLPVTVGIGDAGMPVLFAGYAPGFIGLYQINFVVGASAPSGPFRKLNVKVGSRFSNDSTLAVE